MLRVLENEDDIRKTQGVLKAAFTLGATWSGPITAGYQGGADPGIAIWHDNARIWGTFNHRPSSEPSATRYWNAFGADDPQIRSTSLKIAFEVNPAHKGIDRRTRGAFAKDDDLGTLYLLHRGGFNRVSKERFWENWANLYPSRTVLALEGKRQTRFAVAARLEPSTTVDDLRWFMDRVFELKPQYGGH